MFKIVLGCLVVLGWLVVSMGNGWAGWQRDAVCQGSCGGACGPCSSHNDREDRAESAYAQKVHRYNNLVDQAFAAAKARDWSEAIRIARAALSVLDDDGLRRWLNAIEACNLNEQGQSAYDAGDYARAARLFAQAQQQNPSDPAFEKNARLASAQMQLLSDQSQAKQTLSQLTDTINRTQTAATVTTSGLDFMLADSTAQESTDSGSHPFGTTGARSVLAADLNARNAFNAATHAAIIATTTPQPDLDPMVVDARNVATGLPSSVETEIPHTPAGNRVRKGFQAIMNHDWQVAQAWFKDALDHDPGNAGIMRLIDLSEYTLNRKTHPRGTVADASPQDAARMATLEHLEDDRMDEELQRALSDFNQNYLPKHPELAKPEQPASALPPATEQKANWQAFFDALFTKPSTKTRRPGSVGAVRD